MGTTSVKKAKQSIFNYLLDNSENIKNKLIQFCGGSVKVNLDL
jgi:hypothetical protein